MNTEIGILVLAAGGSSRLGRPKQLVSWEGTTLIRKISQMALKGGANHIGVVVGGHRFEVTKEIKDLPISIYYNEVWENGMGGSLKYGIRKLKEEFPDTGAILILTCDQPFVDTHFIRRLILIYKTLKKDIVASAYGNTHGVPVIFDKSLFPQILELPDDSGAKKVLLNNVDKVEPIFFPYGNIDIDTEEDLKKYGNREPGNKESS